MNYFFTFNDSYSGVYHSQVIDVVRMYQSHGVDMSLIAMVSPRYFFHDRKLIKQHLPDAIVIPSIPKLSNWKRNGLFLSYLTNKQSKIICRGVFATNIALIIKHRFSQIIYDGRGAIKAEQDEYGVYNGTGVEKVIDKLENKAVLNSDSQISVSSKLIEYWRNEYNYNSKNYQIIPCSVADVFVKENNNKDYSLLPGLEREDILLIYSGSLAGWQSLDGLVEIISSYLINKKVKVLFLSREHITIEKLIEKYPDRIYRKWLSPTEVPRYLALGDYGILLRKNNWTNRVASPVKFAEYLSAGLKVLISENIGDFSELVKENDLGIIVNDDENTLLTKVNRTEKERIMKFSKYNFTKEKVMPMYIDVIQ